MKQFILFILVLLPVCAFAQFTETFDGPEIDSNNPWMVSSDRFTISNGKLVLDGASLVDTCFLYIPINYASTMEWEIDVSFSFKPSNANKACIYLYRTNEPSNLIFYIQVGSNGDNVSFYKYPPKGNPQCLIAGKRQLEREVAHVKLTLEENKRWTLYSRLGNENGYVKEGEYVSLDLQDFRDGGNLNITCICNASSYPNNRYFYFDNISVRHELTDTPLASEEKPEEPDEEEPSETDTPCLLSLEEEEGNSLLLTFNMPVDASTSSILLSGEEEDELYQSSDETILKPVWKEGRMIGESYSLSYSGIYSKEGEKRECKGNKSFTSKLGKDVVMPEIPEEKPGAVLFNEVMADTAKLNNLPHTEYVELQNATDVAQPLKGYSFIYDNRITVVLPDITIPALGYAVLYRAGREITIDQGGVGIPLDKFPAQLANAGKLLQLKSLSGSIIDEYTYPKAIPAKSWERSSSGWHLSSDPRGGTPGSVNSSGKGEEKPNEPDKPVTPDEPDDPDEPDTSDDPPLPDITVEPGEFVFNELLPNPFAGGSEYIELYNRSDRALPVSGLSVAVRKADGTLNTRYPLSSVTATIESDGYVLLTKNLEGVTDFYTIQSPSSLFEVPKLPILANTSSTLVLFRIKDGAVIDEVSYTSKWHASSIKDQKGVSLERIDPDAETQSPSNWTSASATVGYGTPGYPNSQSDISLPDDPDTPDEPTGIKTPQWDESAGHYTISYYLDQPGYNCRAFVFNIAGQRVAQIANHELLGLTGKLTWDGYALSGKQLQTGVYIFYAELYHTSGTVKRYKQVFLVR